jgi:predicted MPP superfamily phosphohydrolase
MQPLTRRQWLKAALGAGVGLATGTGAYGFLYERHRIELTREALPVSGLPESLSGLRIGFLTDLHHSDSVPRETIADAVSMLAAERPDVIVLGGDYVTWGDRRFVAPCAEALGPLTAPHGVFAILGNHDDDRDMAEALKARGFEVLKDARTRVSLRGAHIDLAGIRFWTRRVADLARVLRGAEPPIVLLAHDPRRLSQAAALDVGLVLAGHTHGGQVVLPGLGAVGTRGRRFPILAGATRRDSTTLFVSRGIGTVYLPVRLNCPPEAALLTLQPLARA